MRRRSSVTLAAAAFGLAAVTADSISCRSPRPSPAPSAAVAETPGARAVRGSAIVRVDTLMMTIAALDSAAAALDASDDGGLRVRDAFARARTVYKGVEFLVEAYTPVAADGINGPALPEVEEHEGDRPVRPPDGFQVIEALVFPVADPTRATELRQEVAVLRGHVTRVRQLFAANVWNDGVVFDAARQEVARVVALGLAGFDSPVAGRAAPEAAAALRGVRDALAVYAGYVPEGSGAWRRADSTLAAAAAYLDASDDPDRLDRLTFITEHANPSARAIVALRDALGVRAAGGRTLWRADAATLFDAGAFDAEALASPFAAAPTSPAQAAARVALGRRLFADPALSRADRTCATCHDPARAFTDGSTRSVSLGAARLRNAPTLLNAALQGAQFADARTTYLEDQVGDVVANPDEMHGSLEGAAATLRARPGMRAAFAAAFSSGDTGGAVVSGPHIQSALAAYVRSLAALDAPFDRYVRGDTAAMSPLARRGFDVFMGKGKCGTCHFAPLFNGTVPPAFTKAELEVLGVPGAPVVRQARVDGDVGRMRVTAAPLHRHAFKTPTVRNAALTAPYMHNGVYRTLDQVIDFYERGGGAGIGVALPNQTLPPERLRLTAGERRALTAFLRALTDTTAK